MKVGIVHIFLILIFGISNQCHAGEIAYRTVSSCQENGQTKIVRNILRGGSTSAMADNNFYWQVGLGRIWLPKISQNNFEMPFVIQDDNIPLIPSILEFSKPVVVDLTHRKALYYSFSAKGLVSQRRDGGELDDVSVKLKEVGAKSISVEGDGFILLDLKTAVPISGYTHMIRKISSELWRNNDGIEKLTSEVEQSWTEIF